MFVKRWVSSALMVSTLWAGAACSDAKPGRAPADGGSGGQGSGGRGGAGHGGAGDGGAGGNLGPAPNFATATATSVPSPAGGADAFGDAVAVSGDTVIVGAHNDQAGDVRSGAVHVFVRTQESWPFQATLKAQAPMFDGLFGWSVALDGDVAMAGARGHGAVDLSGAAFLLYRSGTSWVSQQELVLTPEQDYAELGSAVAVSGGLAIAGAPGALATNQIGRVFAYSVSGMVWSPAGELVATRTSDRFGEALALDGNTAVVGAPGLASPGAAFVFVRENETWVQQAELTPGDGAAGKHFGHAVSLHGDTVVVGTEAKDLLGAAYVFVRSGTTWSQQALLSADDGTPGDAFGIAVSVSGNAAVVGAPQQDEAGQDAGAAYVFARNGTSWSQQTKLFRTGPAADDGFGVAVGIDAEIAVVGARNRNTSVGTATIFVAR